ncbi:MAG TPA: T9SS type A sorting domain-containing protein [Draconibacterium sp.]|nr:T9SS type A sorting domain-containing protein [Draconibacterium sp.]
MKRLITTISLLFYICILANGRSINYVPVDTVQFEFRDITHIVSVDSFESIKTFVLTNGDRETYSNMYNDNPHFHFEEFELYLNPDIGQANINCDTSKSDFNEVVIKDQNANPQYYYVHVVRKGDLTNAQIHTFEGMVEEKVYLLNFDNNNMDSMINNVSQYIEIIEKEVTTNISYPGYKSIDNIAIYPNPANETLTFESANQEVATCKLYNSTGELLKTLLVENGIYTYNISELKSGIYIIRFQEKEKSFVQKIVKY